jgi:hypothetical protein
MDAFPGGPAVNHRATRHIAANPMHMANASDPHPMQAEILARRSDGWRWIDDRVPVDEPYDTPTRAAEAGAEAIREAVEAERLDREEAVELAADARFELGANEHHMGSADSTAIATLADLESELRKGK